MKKAKNKSQRASKSEVLNFESWAQLASWFLMRGQELDAAERKREAPERTAALMRDMQRRSALERVGVYLDRDGNGYWIANGQPVIGGRKPGVTGWQMPSAFR